MEKNKNDKEKSAASPVIEQPENRMEYYGRIAGVNNPDRNFYEDATQENGNYTNTCVKCKNLFMGNKHRVICKLCTRPKKEKANKKHEAQIIRDQQIYGNSFERIKDDGSKERLDPTTIIIKSQKKVVEPVTEQESGEKILLDNLIDRIWRRAYLDTPESHINLIQEYADQENKKLLSEVSELRRQLETGGTEKRTLFEGSINPMILPQEVEHIKDPAKYIVYLLKKVEELERQLEFYQDKNQNQ